MVESGNFIDGYPCAPGHADFGIHQKIDADMRNAAALRNTAAPPAMLFPEYMALAREERHTWIAPVVERYAWNHERDADADAVLHPLAGLPRMLLWNEQVDDAILFRLAKYGPSLRPTSGEWDCCRLQDAVLVNLERRKGPLGKELGEALRGLVEHLERKPDHGEATFPLAFRSFLEGYTPIPWARDVDVEFPAGETWRGR